MNIKTKVGGLIVSIVFLTGCSTFFIKKEVSLAPVAIENTYREFEILNINPDDTQIYTDALLKFSKQTKGKKIEQIEGNYGYSLEEDAFVPPTFTVRQPVLGYFKLDNHEYWIVESGREYKSYTAKEITSWIPVDDNAPGATYGLYKDGKFDKDVTEIFSQTLCWGIDGIEGMVNDIRLVAGDVAFKYIVGDCTSTSSTVHAYIQGMPQEKIFRIDGSHYPFDYKGKPGFVAQVAGKEYVVIDGRIVSEGYDTIYTNSCCAMPFPVFELYDDGYLYFVGIRDDKSYAVETQIETFESDLILKTNVDKKTLKK